MIMLHGHLVHKASCVGSPGLALHVLCISGGLTTQKGVMACFQRGPLGLQPDLSRTPGGMVARRAHPFRPRLDNSTIMVYVVLYDMTWG